MEINTNGGRVREVDGLQEERLGMKEGGDGKNTP